MRDLLALFVFIALMILLFAFLGDLESAGLVGQVWEAILGAISDLGEAWRSAQ